MAKRKPGFYWHVHHDILLEWCYDYQQRLDYILIYKPKNEQKLRIRLFKPVKGKLPAGFVKEWDKYNAARDKCNAALDKYNAARDKCNAALDKYNAALDKYNAARGKYDAARDKYSVEIEALHEKECPNCPWDGVTIFP